jgi:hypothetical protein
METRLREILDLVNQWLKFAEAKNAALLAANSTIAFALLKSLQQFGSLPLWLNIYVYIAIALLFISAALSLLSFIPKTHIPWIASTRRPAIEDNLLFYGHIAAYDAKSYLKALYRETGADKIEPSGLEEDYAEQIIINSRISLAKYRLFAAGACITLSAILTPILIIPILLITKSD